MGQNKPKPRRRFPTWGIILVLLGLLLLLQNLHVLPWGLWGTLWRFWPAILVIVGVNILLGRVNPWLAASVVLAVLVASIGIALWFYPMGSEVTTTSFSEPLAGITSAEVDVDFGAGRLTISSLPEDSTDFIEVRAEDGSIAKQFRRYAGQGTLELSMERKWWHWGDVTATWEIWLSTSLALELKVRSGASDVDLDLEDLRVVELSLEVGANRTNVVMPAEAGFTTAFIKAGAARVTVAIPDGTAARIRTSVALASVNVDEERFPKSGDHYISPDFDTAVNRIDLSIEGGVADVSIR